MIKKTAALAALISLVPGASLAEEEHLFSEHGSNKRIALTTIGVGGALAAVGGTFFFVGRSGAGLHVNPDGSLKPRGQVEEAEAALTLQRISITILAGGVATMIVGTVLLLAARRNQLTLAPVLTPGGLAVVASLPWPD